MTPGRNRQRGFVLVTTVVCAVVLTAFAGLTIDTGYLHLVKTRMQTAADAAAIGGSQEIRLNGTGTVVSAAQADAAANGFAHGAAGVVVTVNNPPATGSYTSDPTAVEVLIQKDVATFFMGVLGLHSTTVKARSVARLGSSPTCMYVLNPSANNAFQISGGVNLQMSCGVQVNSSSNSAFQASGGARVTTPAINVVGNYSSSGGAVVTPTPVVHVPVQPDPLAWLVPPSVGGCNFTNYSVANGATATLSPAVYCKGLSISGGARVTFNPGTYILLGGGLDISGGATVTGTGLMFYNSSTSGKPYGGISLSGGASVSLSAPASGPWAGILFFQDRSASPTVGSNFSGGTSIVMNGALYFPTTSVSYSGGTGAQYTLIVSDLISFSGGSRLNSDYSALPNGSPIKGGATLAE